MREVGRKPATYEELLALPDNLTGQIIAGELIALPRPAGPHAVASSALGMDLGTPFQRGRGGPGGWWILDEPELHLHEDIVVPDLAGWRTARMPNPPGAAYIELAPDWICEVISPSTGSIDRVTKRHLYARERVSYYWMIDPLGPTLEALKLDGERWVELGSWSRGERARIEPFEAVELELDALWPEAAAAPVKK